MKTISNKELALIGESVAADFLVTNGYQMLCRNFRVKQGEIDLIVEKDQQLIFVEVKTRSYHSIQSAIDNVTLQKQKHISRVALIYVNQNPKFDNYSTRFDVIIVLYNEATNSYNIHHYVDAFEPVLD